MCAIVWSLGHLLTFLLFFVMGMKTDLNIYVYTHTHTHTHTLESLCCTSEVNTTLYINYTSIKKKIFKKSNS